MAILKWLLSIILVYVIMLFEWKLILDVYDFLFGHKGNNHGR